MIKVALAQKWHALMGGGQQPDPHTGARVAGGVIGSYGGLVGGAGLGAETASIANSLISRVRPATSFGESMGRMARSVVTGAGIGGVAGAAGGAVLGQALIKKLMEMHSARKSASFNLTFANYINLYR